jgi:hypothetical protein
MKHGVLSRLARCAALALALAAAAGLAPAAAPGAAPLAAAAEAGGGARVTLESKLRLVKLLLAQSPALQRIPLSDSAPAKAKLAEARKLYERAQAEPAPAAALPLLDEALRQIVAASRLVPDPQQLAAQEQRRNSELRTAILTFQTLQRNAAAGKSAPPDSARLDALVARADALGAGGDARGANAALTQAYQIVVSGLNRMLAARTIVYDLKFASPDEEFRHELARNRAYDELVPIALAQAQLPQETVALAQGYARQGRGAREAAQQQASGDARAAIKTMQDATAHLQRALRVAGVVVPQSPDSQP